MWSTERDATASGLRLYAERVNYMQERPKHQNMITSTCVLNASYTTRYLVNARMICVRACRSRKTYAESSTCLNRWALEKRQTRIDRFEGMKASEVDHVPCRREDDELRLRCAAAGVAGQGTWSMDNNVHEGSSAESVACALVGVGLFREPSSGNKRTRLSESTPTQGQEAFPSRLEVKQRGCTS